MLKKSLVLGQQQKWLRITKQPVSEETASAEERARPSKISATGWDT